jgi:RNA polymerase sigma factor (TIGR02999 family)
MGSNTASDGEPSRLTEPDRAAFAQAVATCSQELPDLLARHYHTLRAVARRIVAREPAGNSLEPTDLVHEAWMQLVGSPHATARGSLYFRVCFARQCRQILVDHARRRNAMRRGGRGRRETLADQSAVGLPGEHGLVEVDDALEALAKFGPRYARIADLRLFGGLSVAECATALGLSERSIVKEWAFARAYLQRQLG